MKRIFFRIIGLVQTYSPFFVVILSIFIASVISYAHLKIFPNILNPTILLEPVLFSEGYLPYNNFGDQKTVLLQYLIATALPIFGGDAVLTLQVIHALLIIIVISLCLIWVFKKKGVWAFLASALFFLSWSLPFGYWAILYFDFVLTPFFGIALFFLSLEDYRHSLFSNFLFGVSTGLAILIKQQGVMLCLLFALLIIRLFISKKFHISKLWIFIGGYLPGLLLPVGLFCLLFYISGGDLREFYYWTVTINLSGNYGSMARQFPDLSILPTYIPSLLGVFLYIFPFFLKDEVSKKKIGYRFWLLVVGLSTLIFIYPRWSGRHLAPLLPFLGSISGIALAELVNWPAKNWKDILKFILYLGIVIWWGSSAINSYKLHLKEERIYEYGEFSNLIELADEIKQIIPNQGSLIILPSDEALLNLYYILDRRPPGYLFFTMPWFLESRVEQRWLEVVVDERPSSVIFIPGRWEIEIYAPEMVQFIFNNYQIVEELTWENSAVQILTINP